MMSQKVQYTWQHFNEDVQLILKKIEDNNWDIRGIYAIPNGGLVLGVVLANTLEVPLYLNFDEAIEGVRNNILKEGELMDENTYEHLLIVDDISDSGKTLIKLPNICEVRTVTLFIKDGTQFIPNFYCRRAPDAQWVVFCWEPFNKDTKRDDTVVI